MMRQPFGGKLINISSSPNRDQFPCNLVQWPSNDLRGAKVLSLRNLSLTRAILKIMNFYIEKKKKDGRI